MVTSTSGAQSANTIADFTLASATPAQSADSFAQQFLTAIEGYLGAPGSNSQLQINIQSAGQNSAGSSQFIVTVQDPPASPASSAPSGSSLFPSASSSAASAATSTPASAGSDTSIFTSTPAAAAVASGSASAAAAGTSSPAASPSSGQAPTAAQLAQMTPTEAYWAEQPPAVQALQNMPLDQRPSAAAALAAQGYTIDVPIMVEGQDPLVTMLTRETDGYTWVPSAMQADVQVAPGISCPGFSSYDPAKPPAGSIEVSTAFADGTNGFDPAAVGWGFTPPATS
jgi:hypothetical protein